MHKHPHLQISYIASGAFETTIGDDTKILKEGDVYFVPSDVMHGVVCLEDGILVDVFNPMREDFVA
jgi:quercetin dioxygenase-like cupin family protein